MGGLSGLECCELLYGRRFSLRLKAAFYASYIRPAILYVKHGAWKKVRLELCNGQKDPW